ncbi:MAG: DUF6089 family protein, partial [Hymenobacteraceae bacterium]|nr:DUF6089 family protein [Hymenobacteraceae bacterium]MDX5512568.1 DUF6089 family protein [Hymenobacteraceae bacterium]
RLEYNFLDYYDRKRYIRWTPYYFIGAAAGVYSNELVVNNRQYRGLNSETKNSIAFAIPTGVGIKLALSRHWNLGAEFGARKTFSDKLDNLTGEVVDGINSKPISNPFDKDWYFYNGISISYTFYKIHCPDIYKIAPGLLE